MQDTQNESWGASTNFTTVALGSSWCARMSRRPKAKRSIYLFMLFITCFFGAAPQALADKTCAKPLKQCAVVGEDAVCYDPKTQSCCDQEVIQKSSESCCPAGYPDNFICDSKSQVCTEHGCDARPTQYGGTVNVKYLVMGIYYAPPGKGSQVTYTSGFDVDTETEITKSFQQGVKVDFSGDTEGGGFDLSTDFNFQKTTGTSSDLEIQASTGFQLTSPSAAPDDKVLRGQDWIRIWINPKMGVLGQTGGGEPDKLSVTLHEASGTLVNVLADDVNSAIVELKNRGWNTLSDNPAPVADPTYPGCNGDPHVSLPCPAQNAMAGFKADDFQNILAMDPAYKTGSIDAADSRYQYTETIHLLGPPHPDSGTLASLYQLDTKTVTGRITGSQTEQSVSLTAGPNFSFFGLFQAKLQIGGQWTWQQSTQEKVQSGKVSSAQAVLSTTTVGLDQPYDVYLDTVYNTFAFNLHTPRPGENARLAGTVTDAKGRPLSGVEVIFTAGTGAPVVRTKTKADGSYAFDSLPATAPRSRITVLDSNTRRVLQGIANVPVQLKANRAIVKILRTGQGR